MKLVCISDTHGHHRSLTLPEGDVLLHAGDFHRDHNNTDEIEDFNEWLGSLDYTHKVIIAGNHDFCLEWLPAYNQKKITNAVYLRDSSVEIEGFKIYGSPWTPRFFDWAFNQDRGQESAERWAKIPDDTDILITHGPPHGILDRVYNKGDHLGCEELRKRVDDLTLKLHVFGHIHAGYGDMFCEKTRYVNASACNERYSPTQEPIVVELN